MRIEGARCGEDGDDDEDGDDGDGGDDGDDGDDGEDGDDGDDGEADQPGNGGDSDSDGVGNGSKRDLEGMLAAKLAEALVRGDFKVTDGIDDLGSPSEHVIRFLEMLVAKVLAGETEIVVGEIGEGLGNDVGDLNHTEIAVLISKAIAAARGKRGRFPSGEKETRQTRPFVLCPATPPLSSSRLSQRVEDDKLKGRRVFTLANTLETAKRRCPPFSGQAAAKQTLTKRYI